MGSGHVRQITAQSMRGVEQAEMLTFLFLWIAFSSPSVDLVDWLLNLLQGPVSQ